MANVLLEVKMRQTTKDGEGGVKTKVTNPFESLKNGVYHYGSRHTSLFPSVESKVSRSLKGPLKISHASTDAGRLVLVSL